MKATHASEAYWTTRLAPYVLAVILIPLALSLRKAIPPVQYFLIGILSGGLVALFHAFKWRTGREVFQLAAMAAWLLPFFVILKLYHAGSFQYVGVFAAAYCAETALLRRRVRLWIQS